jgi:hypothetical protein
VITVAALYVDERPGGCYIDLPGVDAWGESRDARLYAGPHACLAHPPCSRWGRYWSGGPNPRQKRKKLGDDGGCFTAALAAVRRWGGVLEHPEASHAWRYHGLIPPPRDLGRQLQLAVAGGWFPAGDGLGFTCCVEQGHYGHEARKATWLYAVGCVLPELPWGPSTVPGNAKMDEGYHSTEERRRLRDRRPSNCTRISSRRRAATPPAFRDLLLDMARSCRRAL